jgi:hypothetical protein
MKFTNLSWKQTGLINLSLLIITVTFLGVRVLELPTETSPKASSITPTPTPISINAHPQAELSSLNPSFAKPGDMVRLTGKNLGINPTNAKLVFAGREIPNDSISAWTQDYIDVIIPYNTKTNLVLPLGLIINNVPTNSFPLSIYDQLLSSEIGVTQQNNHYLLWIKNVIEPTQLSFTLPSSIEITQTLLNPTNQLDQDDSHQFEFNIPSSNFTPILEISSIPQLKDITLLSSDVLRPLAYFIHPLNPLFPSLLP